MRPHTPSSLPSTRPDGRPWRSLGFVLGLAAVAVGCGNDADPTQPPATASVTVSSPIGSRIAANRSVQLSAVAEDASGNALSGRSWTWSSSAPSIAGVDDSGTLQALGAGFTTVSATADGVSGQLAMEVVAVNLDAISALLDDPWTGAIVSALTDPAEATVQAALAECDAALGVGDVDALEACLDAAAVATSGDPTDQVLLAFVGLIANRSQQHVQLQIL